MLQFGQEIVESQSPLEQIEEFRNLVKDFKQIKYQNLQQYSVFLIGNTREGKSTLFHLLQGHQLMIYKNKKLNAPENQKDPLIGHQGQSYTKDFNIEEINYDKFKFTLIDTPGLNDTRNGFHEVVSQINLYKIMINCQECIYLIVTKFNDTNDNCIQDAIKSIKELFCEHLEKNLFKDNDEEMIQYVDETFNRIINQNKNFPAKDVLGYFLKHKDQIVFFQQCADQESQSNLRQKIIQFIGNQKKVQLEKQCLHNVIMSENAKNKVTKFISSLQNFFEDQYQIKFNNLSKVLEENKNIEENQIAEENQYIKFNSQILEEFEKQFEFCQSLLNFVHESIKMNEIFDFDQKLSKILQNFIFDFHQNCKIYSTLFLFDQNYMFPLLQVYIYQNQQRMPLIDISNGHEKLRNCAKNFAQQLEKLYKQQQIADAEIYLSLLRSLSYLSKIKSSSWDKMILVLGNRMTGKSKLVNLIYNIDQSTDPRYFMLNKMGEFAQSQQNIQPNLLQILNDKDFVNTKLIDKHIVIEWKEFSEKYFSILECYLKLVAQSKKNFIVLIMIDNQEQISENKILKEFDKFQTKHKKLQDWNLQGVQFGDSFSVNFLDLNKNLSKLSEFKLKIVDRHLILEKDEKFSENIQKYFTKLPQFEDDSKWLERLELLTKPLFYAFQTSLYDSNFLIWKNCEFEKDIKILKLFLKIKLESKDFEFQIYKLISQNQEIQIDLSKLKKYGREQFYLKLCRKFCINSKIFAVKNYLISIKQKLESAQQELKDYINVNSIIQIITLYNICINFPSFLEDKVLDFEFLNGSYLFINQLLKKNERAQEDRNFMGALGYAFKFIKNAFGNLFINIPSTNFYWQLLNEVKILISNLKDLQLQINQIQYKGKEEVNQNFCLEDYRKLQSYAKQSFLNQNFGIEMQKMMIKKQYNSTFDSLVINQLFNKINGRIEQLDQLKRSSDFSEMNEKLSKQRLQ